MSTWTAVIGVIEMDDIFPLLTNNSLDDQISDIEKVLGPQWTFYNTKDYESCTLPSGSEGSINYKIDTLQVEHDPDGEQNYKLMITFLGHLRDFNQKQVETVLEPWINKIINELKFVRSYSFSYTVNSGETKTIAKTE